MSFKEFIKELNGNGPEGHLIKNFAYSLITSVLVLTILYLIKLKNIDGFIPKYGFFLLFASLSYAIILPTIQQVKSNKHINCMAGMMVGMTIGMISAFLPSFFIGATNGMFWGSVFGMLIGIPLGIWLGSCCGIMGAMEGIMAGFMGGLMGAMTAVMMLNDNLKLAGIVVFAVSAVIMFGLNYMIYRETKESEKAQSEDSFLLIVLSFLLIVITLWLMVFGPRSILFQ